jgi:glycosyltransferase involved in cell wall biosynthesis
MERISVIMPTYNRAGYIGHAIESVLAQTYRDLELIIIDDGSTDDTAGSVAPYLRDGRVRILRQENGGAAAARNHGLAERRGKVVAFIDSDDIWEPAKLEIQAAVLDALPNIGLVCTDFSAERRGSVTEKSHIRSYFSVLDDYDLEFDEVFSHRLQASIKGLEEGDEVFYGNVYSTMLFGNIILTSTCLIRDEVFNKVGVFDTTFGTLEDYDLFLKVTRSYDVAIVCKPLTRYRYSENQLSGEAHFHRLCENLIKIFKKNVVGISDGAFLEANKRKISKRLGSYHAQHGYFHFAQEEMSDAAKCYLASIRNSPGRVSSYVYLMFSLLPIGITRLIRRTRSISKWQI